MNYHINTEEKDGYLLLDSGNGERLERFGQIYLIRPDQNAQLKKSLPDREWSSLAHARFIQETATSGKWVKYKPVPEKWAVFFTFKNVQLRFLLTLSAFKQVGVFPEQVENWEYIFDNVTALRQKSPRVLNLFGYTGGASFAARAAGAEVTHVEALKQVIERAKKNMKLSGLGNIRWLLDDAVKFVNKEIRRGNLYHGIILDPPSFGRGPKGEIWKLEQDIEHLLKNLIKLLNPDEHFFVLNVYSAGITIEYFKKLANTIFDNFKKYEMHELFLYDLNNKKLPAGLTLRFNNLA
ncbi:MAG: class I SAM-dependent methyltransferase [Bacteroidia bacterium]|nr:class I SAM-dependent methyltransferase [Bacteroidia bacterium]